MSIYCVECPTGIYYVKASKMRIERGSVLSFWSETKMIIAITKELWLSASIEKEEKK